MELTSTLNLFIILIKFSSADSAVVTPSFIENTCPQEKKSLTCVSESDALIWIVPNPLGRPMETLSAGFSNLIESMLGQSNINGDTLGAYKVSLDSVTPRLSSTLEVTLYSSMDGRSIECSGAIVPIDLINDVPGSPVLLQVSDIVNKSENSTVTLQWIPPHSSAEVNYSVTVIPTNNSGYTMLMVSESQIELILQYNLKYMVMVASTNCFGSSFPLSLNFTLVRCDVPSLLMNGMFQFSSQAEEAQLSYTCNDGFVPVGLSTATCTNDTTWQPDVKCQSILDEFETNAPSMSSLIESTYIEISIPERADDYLSIAEITGMSTGITFLMATVIGFLTGLIVMYRCCRKKELYSPAAEGQANIRPTVPACPVYEEVLPKLNEDIELNINQAYGPMLQIQASTVAIGT